MVDIDTTAATYIVYRVEFDAIEYTYFVQPCVVVQMHDLNPITRKPNCTLRIIGHNKTVTENITGVFQRRTDAQAIVTLYNEKMAENFDDDNDWAIDLMGVACEQDNQRI